MAKKITAAPAPSKLRACCSKPECKRLQETVNFMKLWGLDHKPKQDTEGWFFDVSIPAHWNDNRSGTFAKGLAQQPTGHQRLDMWMVFQASADSDELRSGVNCRVSGIISTDD
jgi:hypothetical protein